VQVAESLCPQPVSMVIVITIINALDQFYAPALPLNLEAVGAGREAGSLSKCRA
jgi:hypothetical protein